MRSSITRAADNITADVPDNISISAGIVTFNNIDTIDACVQSILRFAAPYHFTLYIFDNGSSDGTCELLKEKYPSVRFTQSSENLGFGGGHNKILQELHSDFHFIINPDILIKEDAFGPLAAYLLQHQDTALITPRILNTDGSEQYLPKEYPSIRYLGISKLPGFHYLRAQYTREKADIEGPLEILFCTGCFSCINTSIFKQVGGFDKRYFMYFEDADLTRKILKLGKKVIFYPEVSVTHHWKRDNTRSFKGIFREIQSMVKYFNKWGWKW